MKIFNIPKINPLVFGFLFTFLLILLLRFVIFPFSNLETEDFEEKVLPVDDFGCVLGDFEPYITEDECRNIGGRVLDTAEVKSGNRTPQNCCPKGHFLGTILDMDCSCICCR